MMLNIKKLALVGVAAFTLINASCNLGSQEAVSDSAEAEASAATPEPVIDTSITSEGTPLNDGGFRVVGRYTPGANGSVRIFWGATYFETLLYGDRLSMVFDDSGFSWMDVEVDGETTALKLEEGVKEYLIFQGAPGKHSIRVTRRPGPTAPSTVFESYTARGTLVAPKPTERRLLVIGDSIATGYGVEGEDEKCRYSYDTHNAAKAFPFLAADMLDADVHVIAAAGRGLVRNSQGEDTAAMVTGHAFTTPRDGEWDTSQYQPNAVIVHLGTNDFFKANPTEAFVEGYVQLLKDLQYAYPEAHLYMAFGPMLYGEERENAISSILTAQEKFNARGGPQATYIELEQAKSGRRRGCNYHPGIDSQILMAEKVAGILREDLDWTDENGAPGKTDTES